MGLKIAGRLFSGPYPMETFRRRANQPQVVYAVVSRSGPGWDPVYRLVDVGTSGDAGLEFARVAAEAAWQPIDGGTLLLFVDFIDDRRTTHQERAQIVQQVREAYEIPGGIIRFA